MKYKWLKKGFVLAAAVCLTFAVTGCEKGGEVVDTVLEKTNLKEQDQTEQETEEETVPEVEVAKPEFTTNLSGSATYKKGEKAEPLKVEAKTSDSGKITYQWYSSQTNTNGGGTLIEGATESTYAPPTNKEGTMYYYVVATSTIEQSTNGVTSETAEIVVSADDAESQDQNSEEESKSEENTSDSTDQGPESENTKSENTKTEDTKAAQ